MQATFSGAAVAASDGATRLDNDPANDPSFVVCNVPAGTSGSFSGSFSGVGDKLVAARMKPGGSASGSISVDNADEEHEAIVVYTPNGGKAQELGTAPADGSVTVSFALAAQSDELSIVRGK